MSLLSLVIHRDVLHSVRYTLYS